MIVYRITSKKYAYDILGTGAAITGGRWNKKGTPVLYTGESKEIALLEYIAHIPTMLTPDLDILTIKIPDKSIITILESQLPPNWYNYPAPSVLAEIAENWIDSAKSICLKVPSCIIHSAHNYILNCSHPKYHKQVKVIDQRDFHFDSRLNK